MTSRHPLRVGVLTDTFDLGGQERGCMDVLSGLDQTRFATSLYTFRPGALLAEAASRGIPVTVGHQKPPHDRTWTEADRAARVAWRVELADALRRDAVDLAVVWGWGDGVDAAVDAGVPAVVERVDGPSLATRVRDKSACRAVICESPLIKRMLAAQAGVLGLDRRRLVVIPNAVDLDRFDPARCDRSTARRALGLPADAFVVGTVARLAPEKALDQLVEAWKHVVANVPRDAGPAVLVLAGPDGGARATLEALVVERGLADTVRFLGPRDDVPDVLASLDVFVLTSLYEGMPFALLEAIAMGLPIVATHVGAIPEVIDGNGILVAPLDPWATSLALRRLLDEPETRVTLAARSLAIRRRYALPTMLRRYERLLERVAVEAGIAA